jgi:uncharacterized membrane protein
MLLSISFIDMISDPLVITAIVFAALGIALGGLAKRITGVIRKTNDVKPDDKTLITIKIIGLVAILLAFVLLFAWGVRAL